MLNYKGAYDGSTSYSVGDVVVYTDDNAYRLFKAAATGTGCHDMHYWQRLDQPFNEIVQMFHNMLTGLKASADAADAVIFDGNTLILGVEGSDDKYAVTVDASGATPALDVAEVTEEA